MEFVARTGPSTNADQLGALDVRPLDHGEVISAEVTDGQAGGAVQGAVVVREANRAARRELDRRGVRADGHRDSAAPAGTRGAKLVAGLGDCGPTSAPPSPSGATTR